MALSDASITGTWVWWTAGESGVPHAAAGARATPPASHPQAQGVQTCKSSFQMFSYLNQLPWRVLLLIFIVILLSLLRFIIGWEYECIVQGDIWTKQLKPCYLLNQFVSASKIPLAIQRVLRMLVHSSKRGKLYNCFKRQNFIQPRRRTASLSQLSSTELAGWKSCRLSCPLRRTYCCCCYYYSWHKFIRTSALKRLKCTSKTHLSGT